MVLIQTIIIRGTDPGGATPVNDSTLTITSVDPKRCNYLLQI